MNIDLYTPTITSRCYLCKSEETVLTEEYDKKFNFQIIHKPKGAIIVAVHNKCWNRCPK